MTPPQKPPQNGVNEPIGVSALTRQIKRLLETQVDRVCVEGEISNFKGRSGGHWYFLLKDERATIRVTMFKRQNHRVKFEVTDGLEVVLFGRLSVYEPQGSYQIVVERMEPVGLGALQARFEQLKARLADEGLFAADAKKPLPFLVSRVGIVTSESGAALRDMLKVLRRRRPRLYVLLAPAKVQGPGAASQIAGAIRRLNEHTLDVIIVGRGGGSLEDLWAFNEEIVARSIAASRIPVVSAVGHETDYTLADFAADLRAPTPSAAAELVVTVSESELRAQLAALKRRLWKQVELGFERRQQRVTDLRGRLKDPRRVLADFRMRVDDNHWRVERSLRARLALMRRQTDACSRALMAHSPASELAARRRVLEALEARFVVALDKKVRVLSSRFSNAVARLEALSPLQVLGRGYAIARDASGAVVRSTADVSPGQALRIMLVDGEVNVVVRENAGRPRPGRSRKRNPSETDQGKLPL